MIAGAISFSTAPAFSRADGSRVRSPRPTPIASTPERAACSNASARNGPLLKSHHASQRSPAATALPRRSPVVAGPLGARGNGAPSPPERSVLAGVAGLSDLGATGPPVVAGAPPGPEGWVGGTVPPGLPSDVPSSVGTSSLVLMNLPPWPP